MRFSVLALSILIAAAPMAGADAARADEERALLALHENSLQAHRDNDVDALFEGAAENYLTVNRGVTRMTTPAALKEALGGYLAMTTFEYYRDVKPPLVTVSDDGTLGWVAAEVEIKGVQRGADGAETPLHFVSAWVSLFQKVDGEWRRVGNASNFREP